MPNQPRHTDGRFAAVPNSAPEVALSPGRDVWSTDFAKYATALRDGGWVNEIDGETFIDPAAPPDIVDGYSRLLSIGYANGWV